MFAATCKGVVYTNQSVLCSLTLSAWSEMPSECGICLILAGIS